MEREGSKLRLLGTIGGANPSETEISGPLNFTRVSPNGSTWAMLIPPSLPLPPPSQGALAFCCGWEALKHVMFVINSTGMSGFFVFSKSTFNTAPVRCSYMFEKQFRTLSCTVEKYFYILVIIAIRHCSGSEGPYLSFSWI